ncbi:MAG TPA: DUF4902 domain-containing protein [Steroidobacteraceae bacterium]|jgi:hypothetical protein|nr:DUF4902 domain-containing protein [Steroidobacteraceae bacterium]
MNSRGRRAASCDRAPLAVSPDGYVRLTETALRAIPLAHLLSELDPDLDLPPSTASGACLASIVGYTEWVSQTSPALSLGWDWRIATIGCRVRYQREGEVRSNVMLVDARRQDLGARFTGALLRVAVDNLGWERSVDQYISNRYARHLSNLTVTESRSSL